MSAPGYVCPPCDHDAGNCYDVDALGHLPAVFLEAPSGPLPSMSAAETLDPREAVLA